MTRRRRSEKRDGSFSKKLFVSLLGLAGLGVGVWLFRSKRKRKR